MIVFQVLLLVLLALPLSIGYLGLMALAGAYVAVLAALAFKAAYFEARNRFVAFLFLGFFSALSVGASLALLAGFSVFWIAALMVIFLAVFFVGMTWRFATAECALLGWTNGYAVVKVEPSLVAVMPAGIYAVACPKKPAAKKTVRVQFSFFDKKGKVV